MAGPVLGVDGAVGDLRIEPEAVALLAMVERPFERRRRGLAAAPAPAPAPAPAAALGLVVIVLGVLVLVGLVLLGRGGLGLELGGDQRVVLRAQVDLVVEVDAGRALGRLTLGRQFVLALERSDLRGRRLELMSDPGVGPSLADPGADLVEMRAQ